MQYIKRNIQSMLGPVLHAISLQCLSEQIKGLVQPQHVGLKKDFLKLMKTVLGRSETFVKFQKDIWEKKESNQ